MHYQTLVAIILIACGLAPIASAEDKKDDKKEPPRITAIAPLAVSPDTTTTVRIRGFRLDAAKEVKLIEPAAAIGQIKWTIKNKGAAKGGKDDKTKGFGDTQLETELVLPKGVNAVELKFAVVTPDGETPPQTIRLIDSGQLIDEKEPNGGLRTAQAIAAVPCTIRGAIGEEKDVDVYKVAGTAGETLHAEVIAARAASMLDGVLTIYDGSSHILATADDGPAGKDPIIDFKLPADGTYFIALIDAHDRGDGTTHPYLLELSVR